MKRLLNLDWDAIAGIAAAVAALVLHFLHIVEIDVLLVIIMVILAIILIRDLRRESQSERIAEVAKQTEKTVMNIQSAIKPTDAVLIGPNKLFSESEFFSRCAAGDMIWFNVCPCMFKPQVVFDKIFKSAIENPFTTSIQFILDEKEKDNWQKMVLPKVIKCKNSKKVLEPLWRVMDERISFIIAKNDLSKMTEVLLSFWGEPFMSSATGKNVPRYVFHILGHSELVARLSEVERSYRL
ncbi:MAG: hypothetical protein U9N18_03170 [Campylobacterota bacterium]|nr:hypothetical protein [Campylobacterota bacterium]